MRKPRLALLAAVLAIASALAGTASHAQQQVNLGNLPPNTVVGRLGGGQSGGAQSIPFATLSVQIYGAQSANTVFAGPSSGAVALPTFRALVGADLPNPTASTLGGIESYVAVAHQWINAISTSGVPSSTQPAAADLSNGVTGSGLVVLQTSPSLLGTVTGPDSGTWASGGINSSAIGGTTPSTGAFTTLSASSTVSGTGFSTYLASPPAIGGSAAAAGTFTTLTSTTLTNDASLQLNSQEAPLLPGGRITLSSTSAVLTADAANQTTVYYLPYTSQLVPIWNGTHWVEFNLTSSGLNFVLSATNMPTTEMFDVYVVNVSGTPTLCSMYWGSNTARSTTLGGKSGSANASITQLNGLWVNNAAIAANNCFGGASGTTSVTIAQNQGTLLGSFFTSAGGQTGFVCNPAGTNGGSPVLIYISNAYNRVPVACKNLDTGSGQTSTSAAWALLNTSTTIAWIDSLAQIPVRLSAFCDAANSTIADSAAIGIAIGGGGTGTPNEFGFSTAPTSTTADNWTTLHTEETSAPILGLSTAYLEKSNPSAAGTANFEQAAHHEAFTIEAAY